MTTHSLTSLHRLVWTALMAASIAVGAFVQLPIGPVPISMQPFFVFLAGFLLGPVDGAAAVGLYVLAGVAGLPVFAGGASGVGRLVGPTGGYLVGFILAAGICGLASKKQNGTPGWARLIGFGAVALAVTYACGAGWLKAVKALTWGQAFSAGVAPFILFDAVKLATAAACARMLMRQRLTPRG